MNNDGGSRTLWWLSRALLAWLLLFSGREARAGLLDFFKGFTTSGKGQTSIIGVGKNRNSAKYEEYRQIPTDHPVVDELQLNADNQEKNYYFEFRTEDSFQSDARYILRTGKYGQYEMELGWDELPHILSNTGQSLFVPQGDGELTVADDIQRALQQNPFLLPSLITEAHPIPLQFHRDTGWFSLHYTPTPAWDLRVGYTARSDHGRRPLGTTFYFTNSVEVQQPVDALTHEISGSVEYARKTWSLRLAYLGSFYENDVNSLIWDNPFRLDDAVFGPAHGRLTLAPDNQAHTLSLTGAVNLPWRSRLTGTLSYGWMLQNDNFLPYTINSALTPPALPARRLEGERNPFLMNYLLTSRPLDKLTLTARYRFYDLSNENRSLLFPNYVVTDFALAAVARRNLLYAYSTQTTGLEAAYRLTSWGTALLKWEWDKWHREFREVSNSDEQRITPAFALTPTEWLVLRTSYTHAQRDAHGYDALAPEASFPGGEAVQNARLLALRKFDEATRTRDGVKLLAQVTPLNTVSVTVSLDFGSDNFTRSEFGLLRDTYVSPALDVVYSPSPRLNIFANYTYELYDYRQRSRERQVAGTMVIDDPANNWMATGRDTINTVGAGMTFVLVPKKLEFQSDYSISDAFSRLHAGGANPRAVDFPNDKSRFQQLEAIFRYHLRENVTVQVGYRLERYDESDFATTAIPGVGNIQPYMGNVDSGATTSTFLGAYVPNYWAHTAVASVSYQW
jgi:MtrB/PioB family decaheme-associated outer membrane protein